MRVKSCDIKPLISSMLILLSQKIQCDYRFSKILDTLQLIDFQANYTIFVLNAYFLVSNTIRTIPTYQFSFKLYNRLSIQRTNPVMTHNPLPKRLTSHPLIPYPISIQFIFLFLFNPLCLSNKRYFIAVS